MSIRRSQVIKSVIGAVIGGLPGSVWYFNGGETQSIVIAVLGAFVGLALTLPGVSATNVALGTVGAIAASNVSGSLREKIIEATTGPSPHSADSDVAEGERRE